MAGNDPYGRLILSPPTAATVTGVASSATSVTLIAANNLRRQLCIFNASTAILYVLWAATAASVASGGYSVSIQPGGFYELPGTVVYTGAVTGIWSAANGYAQVTEGV